MSKNQPSWAAFLAVLIFLLAILAMDRLDGLATEPPGCGPTHDQACMPNEVPERMPGRASR